MIAVGRVVRWCDAGRDHQKPDRDGRVDSDDRRHRFGAEQFNVARALSRLTVEVATFDATGSLSSIPPTVPVFFPTIMALDFDLLPEQQAMRFDSSRSPRTAWTSSWFERWQKTSP